MATFTWIPTYGAALSVQPRIKSAAFGDGYEQRVGDGINTMPRSWALTFNSKTTDADAIESFLQTAAGVTAFDWTPSHGAAGKFICREWNSVETSPGVRNISATFIEVFGA